MRFLTSVSVKILNTAGTEYRLETQVHEMVNDVVLRVKTATPPPPDFTNPKVQEKIFEERNAPEGLCGQPSRGPTA